jgi:hypothetical protein
MREIYRQVAARMANRWPSRPQTLGGRQSTATISNAWQFSAYLLGAIARR